MPKIGFLGVIEKKSEKNEEDWKGKEKGKKKRLVFSKIKS